MGFIIKTHCYRFFAQANQLGWKITAKKIL